MDDLLDAIIAAPGDPAPRLVYADWLQSRGDPWGELIALQVAGDPAPKLATKVERTILPRLARVRWSGGFIVALDLRGCRVFREDLRDLPQLALVEEIVLPDVRVQAPLALAERRRARRLRNVPAKSLADVARRLPWLDGIAIAASAGRMDHEPLAGLALTSLETRWNDQLPALLPRWKLRRLIFSGAPSIEAIAPILDGQILPGLTELGVVGVRWIGSFVGSLPERAIFPRLRQLQIEADSLADGERRRLGAQRDSWKHIAFEAPPHRATGTANLLLYHLQRPADALALYDQALAAGGDHYSNQMSRANALAWLDRYEEAIAAWDEVITEVPADAYARDGRRRTLEARGLFRASIADARKAVELQPSNPDYRLALGASLERLGENAEALLTFLQASGQPKAEERIAVLRAQVLMHDPVRALEAFRALPESYNRSEGMAIALLTVVDLQGAHAAMAAAETDCPGLQAHIWLLRAIAGDESARRTLLPPAIDPRGVRDAVAAGMAKIHERAETTPDDVLECGLASVAVSALVGEDRFDERARAFEAFLDGIDPRYGNDWLGSWRPKLAAMRDVPPERMKIVQRLARLFTGDLPRSARQPSPRPPKRSGGGRSGGARPSKRRSRSKA